MHRSLLVQEIVRAIMSWVESPGDALAFALSSRTLAEAGLEAVWRHGDTWKLAMTMPEAYRHITVTESGPRLVVGGLLLWAHLNADEYAVAANGRPASRRVARATISALRALHARTLREAFQRHP